MRRILKRLSLVVVLGVSAWLLVPEKEEVGVEDGETQVAAPPRDAKYVIKVATGIHYQPGTQPYGLDLTLQGFAKVARAYEQRFPDTRVEILVVPDVREYLVTQLGSGQAPDIINVNVEDVWIDVQKGWYVPLDTYLEAPNPFVVEQGDPGLPGARQWWDMFVYQAISRGKAAPDNRNYCISYDMVETGIFYNKTLFDELGLEVPETWEAFEDACKRIRAHGKTPLLMNIYAFNDWCTDLFFDQLYYSLLPGIDLVQDPVREQYLQGYLDWDEVAFLYDKGFFRSTDPRYRELWTIMRRLKEHSNNDLVSTDLVREFVTQNAAMLWIASWLTYRLAADPNLGFEWGVFYLPPFTKETSRFASGQPMCVIGGSACQYEVTNSALADTDPQLPLEERMSRSERLKRVIGFLQFMCVPEQYEKIVNEYPCFLPNVHGVEVLPSLEPFRKILERRYTTTKWTFTFDLRFTEIQMRMLSLYLADGIDLDEFLEWQDENLEASVANLRKRKKIDYERLVRAWEEKAEARAGMDELPPGVLSGAIAAEE